jgi:hypothetical protein
MITTNRPVAEGSVSARRRQNRSLLCCFPDGRSFFCDQLSGPVRRLPGWASNRTGVNAFSQFGNGVTEVDAQMCEVDAQLACSPQLSAPEAAGRRSSGRQGIGLGSGWLTKCEVHP